MIQQPALLKCLAPQSNLVSKIKPDCQDGYIKSCNAFFEGAKKSQLKEKKTMATSLLTQMMMPQGG
jgi:hypothetical protein